jgi:hypothetical protein
LAIRQCQQTELSHDLIDVGYRATSIAVGYHIASLDFLSVMRIGRFPQQVAYLRCNPYSDMWGCESNHEIVMTVSMGHVYSGMSHKVIYTRSQYVARSI